MFLHRINVLFLSFFIAFTPFLIISNAYAADQGDWWLQREIQLQQNREDYARRVYGSARHTYDVVSTDSSGNTRLKTITKNVVVEDVPSKRKLGKVLLQRAKAFRGGIAGILGGAAISALIEGVGWVMEEGTYVKYKMPDGEPESQWGEFCYYTSNTSSQCNNVTTAVSSPDAEASAYCQYWWGGGNIDRRDVNPKPITQDTAWVYYDYGCTLTSNGQYKLIRVNGKRVAIKSEPEQPQRIVITDEHVGGIVTGDYTDPVDETKNINDKQYRPVVADAYNHDPSGIGDDLANEMDDRIKNAPPTDDGQPAPAGDHRYSNPPNDDENTNDRSWDDDTPNDANGDTKPNTDPVTGEPTGGQSISLQFPVFCEWAHTMCKWYDDWKASDTVYKDHMKKTEDHQTEEKTFWGRVTGFFDWAKEDDLPDKDDSDLDSEDDTTLQTVSIDWGAQCPEKQTITYELMGQSIEISIINFEAVCPFAPIIKPIVIFGASLESLYILAGIRRSGGSEND